MNKIGIIGGTGFEKSGIVENMVAKKVTTLWGDPSDDLKEGTIGGVPVAMISRHGPEHRITPTHVPYRANIIALKDAGCDCILATTAAGSLRGRMHPGDFVVLDQFIDFTRLRTNTFRDVFVPGEEAHTAMPDPFDAGLRSVLIACCKQLGLSFHKKGTVITIEGTRFSTRAESKMYRVFGADVVNMSVATEAALANEAHIPYAAVAMCTDYDAWRDKGDTANWDDICAVFNRNVERMNALLKAAVVTLGARN